MLAQICLACEARATQKLSPGRTGISDSGRARELDVLQLLGKGKSNREIAVELAITEATVKGHVTNILSKLGVTDRTQAVIIALKGGLIHL